MFFNVSDLTFSYKGQMVLEKIGFTVNQGETTAILGPNGVGKTTLLKCLNRILLPRKGKILVKGKDLRTLGTRDIAKTISYVAQKSQAARVTGFDAVLMGRTPHVRRKASTLDLKKTDAVIRRLGLSDLSLKTLDCMSGGEVQKICIARALVQETDILLMDEPTASLDLKNQTRILGLIRHIVKEHRISAVMTLHDLNAAMRYADRYIFLKEGTIYSAGKVEDITPEMVADVYGLKVDITRHRGLPLVVPLDQDPDHEIAA